MSNIFDEFKWRGLVFDHTEDVPTLLAKEKIKAYIGFDPTADSLHIGSLVPIMGLARLQRFGHTPVALVGGGTGMIGDPSGRSDERNLLSAEQIDANVAGQRVQLERFLDFEVKSNPARIVNNLDWLSQMSMIEYLRDVGKHFTVNYMMAKDSVKSRMGRDSGLSYTEFSYMLLQSYDFMHLYKNEGVQMQLGGSDQWGNITAGVNLIRKKLGEQAHAMVYPLVTKSDGSKFGKTASGTVWLDAKKTSPYRFYQFWLNSADNDAINYLKYFTWLSQDEIGELETATVERAHERAAQRKLAEEITTMAHGEAALQKAQQATSVLFGGSLDGLDATDISDIFAEVPSSEVSKTQLAEGLPIVDLLAMSGIVSSKGDARRSLKGGAINLNNQRVTDAAMTVSENEMLDGQFIVLRKGKKQYHLVRVIG